MRNTLVRTVLWVGGMLAWTAAAFGQVPPPPAGEQLRDAAPGADPRDIRLPATAPAETQPATRPSTRPTDPISRIRDEGMNRSQVMATLSYLTDVIGPRLTGSPNLKRANEWTRDRMTSWGMADARLEAWGPFGKGWSLKRYSAQIIEPQFIPLAGAPKAWSPGFDAPLTADVIYLDAKTEADLQKYHGKLKGAIVLANPVRPVAARFEPLASRVTDANLLQLANADPASSAPPGQARAMTAAERQTLLESLPAGRAGAGAGGRRGGAAAAGRSATRPASAPAEMPSPATQPVISTRVLSFLAAEDVGLIVSPSTQGDGGTFFVAQASVPTPPGRGGGPATAPATQPGGAAGPRPWATDAPPIPAQIALATEDYNRLVRMSQQGEKLKMTVDLQVQFHTDDPMAYNTVAEIPGTDLKDQIVMLGAHLDSWHSGTGATDNAAGVAAVMEAVRILQALDLKPRRTIRVGLWTGEEQGLFGSKAYVTKHFGSIETPPAPAAGQGRGRGARRGGPTTQPSSAPATRPTPRLLRGEEYDRLSVYLNLDNGTGKIRGVYLQNNEAARPLFRRWLSPFRDLGAETITPAGTGGTDHLSFDAIGLPGFQFIQDPIEYFSRTHHSNADVFDRASADDLKQAATILAACAYDAAMADERFPRKPEPAPPANRTP